MITAFKNLSPDESIRLVDVVEEQKKGKRRPVTYVVIQYETDNQIQAEHRLKLHKRKNGTHYFNWRAPDGRIYRIDTQDFIIAW